MIEKEIVTLTAVAQEMQECPERQKYVEALMNIARRINDVEDKASSCIKEARLQLKKTSTVDKEKESDEEDMDVAESHIEISALTSDSLEKLQNHLHKVLIKQSDANAFNPDDDNRYADFAECISRMQDDDDDANVIDQVTSNVCPLTQKAFVEPVQSKKCKHKYEKTLVLKYIADKNKARRPAKCPSAGCEAILHEKDLINA